MLRINFMTEFTEFWRDSSSTDRLVVERVEHMNCFVSALQFSSAKGFAIFIVHLLSILMFPFLFISIYCVAVP